MEVRAEVGVRNVPLDRVESYRPLGEERHLFHVDELELL